MFGLASFIVACTAVAVSQVADVYTTLEGLKLGATEINGLLGGLVKKPVLFYFVKASLGLVWIIPGVIFAKTTPPWAWAVGTIGFLAATSIGIYAAIHNEKIIKDYESQVKK